MSNLETLHQQAASLYEEKKLDEAIKIYEEIIRLNPVDEVALSCAMDIYLEIDDKFNYYLARANVNISQGKIEYAIRDTKKALEINTDSILARRKLARLYRADNKNLKAIDEFLRVLEIDCEDYDAFFELVDLYMLEDSIDSAINIAQRTFETFPNDARVRNMLAQLYFKANDYKQALEVVEDYILKIKILLQDEQNDEAFELLSKIDYSKMNDIEKRNYHILKGQYLYNTKDYSNALAEINEYVKKFGEDALTHQMKALIFDEMNDEFNSYLNWGYCKKLQGKSDEAIVEFEHAIQINSNSKEALVELATLYQHNKERFVAVEYWEKAYAIDKDEKIRDILAEFYYSEGNFEKAEQYGKTVERKEENYEGFLDKIMAFFSKK